MCFLPPVISKYVISSWTLWLGLVISLSPVTTGVTKSTRTHIFRIISLHEYLWGLKLLVVGERIREEKSISRVSACLYQHTVGLYIYHSPLEWYLNNCKNFRGTVGSLHCWEFNLLIFFYWQKRSETTGQNTCCEHGHVSWSHTAQQAFPQVANLVLSWTICWTIGLTTGTCSNSLTFMILFRQPVRCCPKKEVDHSADRLMRLET